MPCDTMSARGANPSSGNSSLSYVVHTSSERQTSAAIITTKHVSKGGHSVGSRNLTNQRVSSRTVRVIGEPSREMPTTQRPRCSPPLRLASWKDEVDGVGRGNPENRWLMVSSARSKCCAL
ncbi:hypothetical protein CIHG_04559 [Coccidioides immitis H538.4]|uniref:Uncharacterized protein n=2 Tax=Coccidioides immitis TaxID=5501 RepID=A0A0J8RNU8_COCIT|nr:hypothetical protein CIRG_06726 [Coccidioides immitis RMSCC 2394]KMU86770.1 hypothetical protein CIHG_04559 [Coccidioides immitis H538.4]